MERDPEKSDSEIWEYFEPLTPSDANQSVEHEQTLDQSVSEFRECCKRFVADSENQSVDQGQTLERSESEYSELELLELVQPEPEQPEIEDQASEQQAPFHNYLVREPVRERLQEQVHDQSRSHPPSSTPSVKPTILKRESQPNRSSGNTYLISKTKHRYRQSSATPFQSLPSRHARPPTRAEAIAYDAGEMKNGPERLDSALLLEIGRFGQAGLRFKTELWKKYTQKEDRIGNWLTGVLPDVEGKGDDELDFQGFQLHA